MKLYNLKCLILTVINNTQNVTMKPIKIYWTNIVKEKFMAIFQYILIFYFYISCISLSTERLITWSSIIIKLFHENNIPLMDSFNIW